MEMLNNRFFQDLGKIEKREGRFWTLIDDFGAGFISLPFVAKLIPDYIKMDRSTFVQATSSEQFGSFLKDLILALRNYSKEGFIAEGIENERGLKVAQRIGATWFKGISRGKINTCVNGLSHSFYLINLFFYSLIIPSQSMKKFPSHREEAS